MTKPYEHWMILPHGALAEIDEGILTAVGQLRMPRAFAQIALWLMSTPLGSEVEPEEYWI